MSKVASVTRNPMQKVRSYCQAFFPALRQALEKSRRDGEPVASTSTDALPAGVVRPLDLARRAARELNNGTVTVLPRPAKEQRPRVAYIAYQLLDWQTHAPSFGGGERYCLTLGSLLRTLGFDVTLFQGAFEPFEGDYYGFKVIGLPIGARTSEFQYGLCEAFSELTADYDYVIFNQPEFASGRMRAGALLICQGIWFDHEYYGEYRTLDWFTQLYRAFSQPAKVISVDTNTINVLRALWPELAARVTYLPNWVDTEIFQPPRQRPAEPLTVLFPRRSQINRGSRILAEILAAVPHDCRFRWVGEGDPTDTAIIKAVAQQDARLEFHAVPFEEMPRFYQEAEIAVIPTVACEGTSLACLEALASGCAVVSTHVGGLADLVQPAVNGLLVDPEPKQIAAAINFLIEHPAERARLQQAARQTAAHFSLKVWQQRWIKLLQELGWLDQRALVRAESV